MSTNPNLPLVEKITTCPDYLNSSNMGILVKELRVSFPRNSPRLYSMKPRVLKV